MSNWYEKYCNTQLQEQIMGEYETLGSSRQVADKLALDDAAVRKTVRVVKKRAAEQGVSPEAQLNHPAPAGYVTPFITAHYKDGELQQAWMRYKPEEIQRLKAINNAIDSMVNECKPFKLVPAPGGPIDDDLHTVYHFTDFHLGMYAWSKECGDDWDMEIAETAFMDGLSDLMNRSPNSKYATFAQMGDFLHWDGLLAVTPQSQHVVDADTRYDKLVELSMRVTVKAIHMMLQKHDQVVDIQMEGNHDISGSIWLRKHHKIMFANNPRVTVDDSVAPYYATLFGDNLLAFHHGHKRNNKQVAEFFSGSPKFRPLWGQAKRTYIKTGHYHSGEIVLSEVGGAIVERLPTLAAKDSYAARGGWNSFRSTSAVTYHKTKGQHSSVTTVPVEVREEFCV